MKCFKAECEKPLVYSFVWGWGEHAHCCEAHKVEAQQIHDAQERGQLTFQHLDPAAAVAPVTRDERTLLIAARMSAEEETEQVKVRAAELQNDCVALKDETRKLLARNVNLEQQIGIAREQRDQAVTERDEALATLHETQEELRRTKLLIPRDPPPNVVG